MPALDELRDEVEHAVDVLGRVGDVVGTADAEPVHLVEVRALVGLRELGLGRAPLGGAGDDLVLDVGDVAHEGDVEPRPLEVAADHVEHERGSDRVRRAATS